MAVPPDRDATPNEVAPSENSTVPVGVPEPGGTAFTVAVKVTGCQFTDGSGAVLNTVVVDALFTVWVKLPVLGSKPLLLVYSAVIEWLPVVRVEVLKVAVAGSPASEPVPSIAAPFLNVTVPVGALAASLSLTVAVNVTDWPKTEGFREDITVVVVPGMNSYAPISQCVPCGRVTPRWSTPFTGHAAQIESSPPFIAGLPATSAIVCVGPPLP